MEHNQEVDKTYYILNDLQTDTYIYRYMDLDYFLCLIKDRKFFVSKKNCFQDMNETRPPFKSLYPFSYIENNLPPDTSYIEKIMNITSKKWKDYKDTGEWFASCWTLRHDENYLMWKAYTSKFGVRICTSIDSFVDSITPNDYYIFCGRILYEGYCPEKDVKSLAFSKGRYYSNEEEFRFYFIPQSGYVDKKYIELPINLIDNDGHNVIKEITLSPFIKKKAAEEVKKMLSGMPELNNCNISISKIELK